MLQSLNYFTYQERHFSIKYNNFDICLKVFQLRRQILLPTKYSIQCCIIKASLILVMVLNIFHPGIRYKNTRASLLLFTALLRVIEQCKECSSL